MDYFRLIDNIRNLKTQLLGVWVLTKSLSHFAVNTSKEYQTKTCNDFWYSIYNPKRHCWTVSVWKYLLEADKSKLVTIANAECWRLGCFHRRARSTSRRRVLHVAQRTETWWSDTLLHQTVSFNFFFFFWLGPRLEPTNTALLLNPFFIYSSAQSFHLPTDGSVPVIMIGNGTGIAPFRSFWQQRMFDLNNRCPPESSKTGRRQWGDMLLFFGCRNSHLDDIYRHETDKAKQSRAITAVATAYSRQQGRPKVYTI